MDRWAIVARNLVLVTKPEDLEEEKALVTKAHEDVQSRLAKLNEMAADKSVPDSVRTLIANIDNRARLRPVALQS